jgi:hypothetical protein
MKKYLIIAAIALAVAAVVTIWVQHSRINQLTGERDEYRTNTETLLQDVSRYQTKDSLNVARVGVLELELSEYKKYRESDAELIKSLQLKNRELQNVTSAQMETITKLNGNVRDSIVYLPEDTTTIVLKCVDISDPWFSLNGCATPDGKFTGTFINRDSILIVETIEYKRFLNFLWKTKKIKNRDFRIISRNPHTKILGFEVVTIRK